LTVDEQRQHGPVQLKQTGTDLLLAPVAGLSQEDLVAMLRSRARKSTSHTSSYRGVSLLKQTGKWHAQINVGGKQVQLTSISGPCMLHKHSAIVMWV